MKTKWMVLKYDSVADVETVVERGLSQIKALDLLIELSKNAPEHLGYSCTREPEPTEVSPSQG